MTLRGLLETPGGRLLLGTVLLLILAAPFVVLVLVAFGMR